MVGVGRRALDPVAGGWPRYGYTGEDRADRCVDAGVREIYIYILV